MLWTNVFVCSKLWSFPPPKCCPSVESTAPRVMLPSLLRDPTWVYLPPQGYSNRSLASTDSDSWARKTASYLIFSGGAGTIDERATVIIGGGHWAQHTGSMAAVLHWSQQRSLAKWSGSLCLSGTKGDIQTFQWPLRGGGVGLGLVALVAFEKVNTCLGWF